MQYFGMDSDNIGVGRVSEIKQSEWYNPLMWAQYRIPGAISPFFCDPWPGDQEGISKAVLVGPNQGGKTWNGSLEALWRMIGVHPFRDVPKRAVHGWLICHSKKQSLAVQRVLAELAPKHLVVDYDYNDSRGFLNQTLKIRSAWGGISILEIKTVGQDNIGLASATIDFVWVDEPPPQENWSELLARLLVRKGALWATMTCVGRPVEWFRDLVEKGIRPETHVNTPDEEHYLSASFSYTRFALNPRNCPHLDYTQCAMIAEDYLEAERRQRVGGYWEGVTPDRYVSGFDPAKHVVDTIPFLRDPGLHLGLTFDHGERPGTQIGLLFAWVNHPERPKLCFLDEYAPERATSVDQDASGTLAMLDRNGVDLRNVPLLVGDTNSAGKSFAGVALNDILGWHLSAEWHKRMGMPAGANITPVRIDPALKAEGSVQWGVSVLSSGFIRGDFLVHRDCKRLAKGLTHWRGGNSGPDGALKHAIDAGRYGAVAAVGETRPYARMRDRYM